MKKIIAVVTVSVVTITLFLFGEKLSTQLDTNDTNNERYRLLSDSLFAYHIEWQIFIDESELAIRLNEVKLRVVKERLEESGPKDLLLHGKTVIALEEKNIALKNSLEDYKSKRHNEWIKFRMNFQREMNVIEKKIKNL